jgi:coenzyme Q-binding protein COQ10
MHSFKSEKILPNSLSQILELIMDIESYPEFVPWCKSTKIISSSNDEIIAEMEINYKGFTESYRSSITKSDVGGDMVVEVKAINGPFKFLNNKWIISSADDGTKINFSIELEFKSFILDKMMGLVFVNATEKMINSFVARAQLINDSSVV